MRRGNTGITLVELMVAVTVALLVLAGVGGFYIYNLNASVTVDLEGTMESNLRTAMYDVSSALRNAGYGVPQTNLGSWITWVSGFTANPLIVSGSGGDTVSIASCTSKPVATLAADAAAGANSLILSSVAGVDTSSRGLIFINNQQSALITTVNSSNNTIAIDTDPTTAAHEGIARAYLTGTPICRVDVLTYSVDTTTQSLKLDTNQGGGAQPIVTGITHMTLTPNPSADATVPGGYTCPPTLGSTVAYSRYEVILRGVTSKIVPGTGAVEYRDYSSCAVVRN